jgi:RNA polymerase sigma-70 factor (ECF subfamily)
VTERQPDDEVVARAVAGDRTAIEALLERNYDQIAKICGRIASGPAEADDCTQEALIAIVKGLPRFDGRSQFSTWAHRVATNACLDELRRRSRRAAPTDPSDLVELVGGEADPSESIGPGTPASIDARIDLDAMLATIAPEFRIPLVMREVADLEYSDIADSLDVPIGTVKSRIARGRAALAAAIDEARDPTERELQRPGNFPTPERRPTD